MSSERDVLICNAKGLHARAAAQFVKTVGLFSATVTVTRDGTVADGRSVMNLLILAAPKGSTITIQATGDDAEAAMEALVRLVENGFGEDHD